MTTLLSLHLVVVAAAEKAPDPDNVKPGLLGFVVFVALAVAVALLWFSLRKQLGKVNFDEDRTERPSATGGDDRTTQA